MDSNYSLNSKNIKQAATELINDNADLLIQYIYNKAGLLSDEEKATVAMAAKTSEPELETVKVVDKAVDKGKKVGKDVEKESIFCNTEIRIGLSIRILAKTNKYYDDNLVNLILNDIDYLRHNSDYLLSFKDPKARKAALDEEYALVQGYIDMDDTISLNQEDADTQSRISKIGKLASDGQCTIQ